MILVLPFVLGALLIAVGVHFASLLALPSLATNDAYARLGANAPMHEVMPLSRQQLAAMRLPFYDQSFAASVCKYDLAEGVLRLRAPVPGTMMLVTLIGRGGNVFFSVTDRAAIKGTVEVLVGTNRQMDEIEASDKEDEVVGELRVRAPQPQGIALVRVFAPDASMRAAAATEAAQATCQIETL